MNMREKGIAAAVAVAVLLVAFLIGYWPQSRARSRVEADLQTLQQRLDAAEAHMRSAALLGQVLTLKEIAGSRNYGQAQEMSSRFFDAVRAEAMTVSDSGLRDALTEVLGQRDAVTSTLAVSDPAATDALHAVETRLRRALGFAMPPASAP